MLVQQGGGTMGPIQRAVAVWRARSSLRPVLRRASPSFSQYGEDLIFDRLLSPGIGGVYVDVGANEPIGGSNTYRMYLRGWSGLAIDPNPRFAADFRRYRPRDKHLVEGVSRQSESLIYHEFDQHVYNTLDPERAAQLVLEGRRLIRETTINCRPLSQIVDQYLPDRHIDLLNVDCEGLDLQVLESLDLTRRRPTAMIVEDYRLFKTFQTDEERGPMGVFLRDHGYRPIAQTAWSGIYVAEDWRDLFRRSPAFDEARVQNGYLPGQ